DPDRYFDVTYFGNDVESLRTKYNRNSIIKKDINKLNQNNILQNFYWSLSYNHYVLGILKNYFKPGYDYKNYSGYDPLVVSENQAIILKNKLKNSENNECTEPLLDNEIYVHSLKELKSFCEANNKTLILFSSPILDDDCKNDNIQFKELMEEKGFTYYDFTDYFKNDYSLEYWKDRTHLSHKGAEMFSSMMKEKLEHLLMIKKVVKI